MYSYSIDLITFEQSKQGGVLFMFGFTEPVLELLTSKLAKSLNYSAIGLLLSSSYAGKGGIGFPRAQLHYLITDLHLSACDTLLMTIMCQSEAFLLGNFQWIFPK